MFYKMIKLKKQILEENVMNCPNCGAPNPDGGKFCIKCGTPLTAAAPAAPVETPVVEPATPVEAPVVEPAAPVETPAAPAYAQPVQPTYEQPVSGAVVTEPQLPTVSKVLGIVGMVCGIMSIAMFCVYYVSPIFAIAGLVLSIVANNQAKAVDAKNSMAKTGIICSAIGLGILAVYICIIILLYVGLIAGAGMDGFYY